MSRYEPNDSNVTVQAVEFLHSPAGLALRQQLSEIPGEPTVGQIQKLRKHFPPEAVHAGLVMAALQEKAMKKFPALADEFVYALPEALEQATDQAVARHKASRFAAAGATRVVDFCSGIGGDAMALAQVAPTEAVDLSAVRLACLRLNVERETKFPLQTRCADVNAVLPANMPHGTMFHVDPARRSGGKRSPRWEDLIPGPQFLDRLLRTVEAGAIKLSSAVDFHSLPPGHLEIISHDKTVVQAVLWVGSLAEQFPGTTTTRTATIFKNHRLLCTYTASPSNAKVADLLPAAFLFELDPAFTRSGLAAPLAESLRLQALTEDAGYVAGQRLETHPAMTAFQALRVIPYSEAKLVAALKDSSLPPAEAGPVEVKTRGRVPGVDTDRLQKLLTTKAPTRRTVFVFRNATRVLAVIAERV